MGRFVEVSDRQQASFLPACLEDYVDADSSVRIIDAFVDELEAIGRQLEASPDGQISLTDPDARAVATGSDSDSDSIRRSMTFSRSRPDLLRVEISDLSDHHAPR